MLRAVRAGPWGSPGGGLAWHMGTEPLFRDVWESPCLARGGLLPAHHLSLPPSGTRSPTPSKASGGISHVAEGALGVHSRPFRPALSSKKLAFHTHHRVRGRSSRGHSATYFVVTSLCAPTSSHPALSLSEAPCPCSSGGQSFCFLQSSSVRTPFSFPGAPCQGQQTLGELRGWPAVLQTLPPRGAERMVRRVCGGGGGLEVGPHWRTLMRRLGGGRRPVAAPHLPPSPPPTHPLRPCAHPPSYGRVYAAAEPYHHTIGPAATYSIGTMVRRRGRPGPARQL